MPLFAIPEQFGTEEEWMDKFSSDELFKEFTSDEYGDNQLPHRKGLSIIKRIGGYSTLSRIKLESDYLEFLTYKKARAIYGDIIPEEVNSRLKFELHILKIKGLSNYFLFAQDLANFLSNNQAVFLSSYNGSESSSLVAYCLGITKVDPLEYNLMFEYYIKMDSNIYSRMWFAIDKEGLKMAKEWLYKKYGEVFWLSFPYTSDFRLTCLRNIHREIKKKNNIDYKMDEIPLNDKNAFEIIKNGNCEFYSISENSLLSSGIFEISSFEDFLLLALFVETNSHYIDIYCERKNGIAPWHYDIPCMERYLKDTCGILLYEEQLVLLSRLLADYTRKESHELIEVLRKGRSKKQRMAEKFLNGGMKNGYDKSTLLRIWNDWCRFSLRSYSKSSVVNEVWMSYQMAFFKAYYPDEYGSVMYKR